MLGQRRARPQPVFCIGEKQFDEFILKFCFLKKTYGNLKKALENSKVLSVNKMNVINHIAILVPSVEGAALVLSKYGYHIGPKEEWEGEGTAEIYVGDKDHAARLLLMEPIKSGAYSRAMEKRGPGLHHVAIDVLTLDTFISGLAGSGWYLHPKSLQTARDTKTAWLTRPGTAMLIEVQERDNLNDAPAFVTKLELPLTEKEQSMVAALGVEMLRRSKDERSWVVIGENRIDIDCIE